MVIAQVISLILACILDLIFGDPDFPLHPIRLIGGMIGLLERGTRFIFPKNKAGEIIGGFITVLLTVAISGAVPFFLLYYAYSFDIVLGAAVETVICYFMLSGKALAKAAKKVYSSLIQGNVNSARRDVSMIVGRDTDRLDDEGIARAAIETVAENANDGVVAPLFYMALGGGVLGCVYKAVNTMDSMLGYKNEKYINFGKIAARLDDVMNYIPSRIAAYVMIIAAYILRYDGGRASLIHRRDCRKHDSPNSAQTESVMAGALRIQLAGDAYYFGELHKKPFIGDPIRPVKYIHIIHAIKMMYVTGIISAAVFMAVKVAVGHFLPLGNLLGMIFGL